MIYQTVEVQIKNPSGAKKKLMDAALLNYSRAFQYLLDGMEPLLPEIAESADRPGGARVHRIVGMIPKELSAALNRFQAEPFKDALKMDYAITLVSYLGIRRTRGGSRYPLVRLEDGAADAALAALHAAFLRGELDRGRFGRELNRIVAKYEATKAVLFCRYAASRDYCLLYDPEKDRYYAKLFLLSVRSPGRPRAAEAADGKLRYIGLGGGPVAADLRARRYIIVPLAFGRRQREILRRARDNPAILKTARLSRRGGAYYLALAVATEPPPAAPSAGFMGIARTPDGLLHYSVCDEEGSLLDRGLLEDRLPADFPRRPGRSLMHGLSKRAAALAREKNAQVVLMNCADGRTDRLFRRAGADPPGSMPLKMGEYRLLAGMLQYKLPLAGLPPPVLVSPNGLFTTCPRCGHTSPKNRPDYRLFLCTCCGYFARVGELGSYNLANRLNRYRKSPIPFEVRRQGGTFRIGNRAMGIDYLLEGGTAGMDAFFAYLDRWRRTPPPLGGLSAQEARLRLSLHSKLAAAPSVSAAAVFRQID